MHGAVTLTAFLDNSAAASAPEALVMFFGLRDCRDRLIPPYNELDKFPGYVIGMSPLRVRLAEVAAVYGSVGAHEKERAALLQIASQLKAEYARQKAHPSLLAVEAQIIEILLAAQAAGGG